MFRPSAIVGALSARFGNTSEDLSREEQRTLSTISMMMMSGREGQLEIRQSDQLCVDPNGDVDSEWSGEEDNLPDENHNRSSSETDGLIMFGDKGYSTDYIREVIEYYREPEKGYRTKEMMTTRYRFLTNPYHYSKLLELEKQFNQEDNIRADLRVRRRELVRRFKEEVERKIASFAQLDDEALSKLARQINDEHKLLDGFTAGQTWVNKFKKNYGYSSRAITSWESPNTIKLAEEIEAKAEQLVATVRSRFAHFPLSSIVNCDQSGVVKELYKARTITKKGVKKVICGVQRKTALTHSFTIMPSYFASGHLGKYMYVVLPEPKGVFPAKGHIQVDNLIVRAARSHMMTKQLMVDWLNTCVFHDDCPNELLLLVDSWSSFNDHATMQGTVPTGKTLEIYNVPPGATSKIQPCDVTLFRQMKSFLKKMSSHVRFHDIDFIMSTRDNILLLISQMYFCFCSPIFRPFLSYGWYKAGYVDERPDCSFLTPTQFCFNGHVDMKCEVSGCIKDHLLKCPYCHNFLCFDHFIVSYHRC